MVLGLQNMNYEQTLEVLGLTTLKERRRRCDLIKILKNIEDVDYQDLFHLAYNHHALRRQIMKLLVPQCLINFRSKFLSQRVLKDWNSLPQHIIDADTTNAFKNRLDAIWSDMSN